MKDMYTKVLFSVKLGKGITDFFHSKVGVKQGLIFIPTLFSLYINDLPLIFDDNCDPTQLNDNNISCLLYADDLVLISESSSGLQRCLDKLSLNCNSWDLTVNFDKSKVMIFNKSGRKINQDKFIFNNSALEYCTEYKYLGILFKPSGSFTEATNLLCKKASKATLHITSYQTF